MNKRIFIGGAWPYANYNMHIGHLAALLPGDIIARYFRQHGDEVLYVSGTDTHGTPITEAARKQNISPEVIAHKYHESDVNDFNDLDFSYDNYSATYMDSHKNMVKDIFKLINENGYLYEKNKEQVFCEHCNKFLSDREIGGVCPVCGKKMKGDQCDSCLSTFDTSEILDKNCLICSNKTVLKMNKELVFSLSKFQDRITEYSKQVEKYWRTNAINETAKYLSMGLPDRDATRSLPWGIEVPFDGYSEKRIYVWFEAVLGYLTSGREAAEKAGIDFDEFMKDDGSLETYYVHGKDNIPFHTVIFPALIMAMKKDIQLPRHIISSEYVNIEDEKMSKSVGNLITIRELIDEFDSDTIRFYFIFNNPERKDVSYKRADLIAYHNKFLVGGLGNFINRNLSYIMKKFEGKVPNGIVDDSIRENTRKAYESIGEKIAAGSLRSALEDMLLYVQDANKYYDSKQPWIQVKNEDLTDFNNTTATCLYMIANISNIFAPIIPRGCAKIREMIQIDQELSWGEVNIKSDLILNNIEILYEKFN